MVPKMTACLRAEVNEDTILVNEAGYEMVTPATDWPMLNVTVKGKPIQLPDILVRESSERGSGRG